MRRWGRELGPDHVEPWFQPGLHIFARFYGNEEPLEGIRWAERIADPATRNLTMVQIANGWRVTDPAAAEAWIETSPLSEKDRQRARGASGPMPVD
jgi:hypothetical protein